MEDLTPKSCSLRFLAGLSYFVRFSSVAWNGHPCSIQLTQCTVHVARYFCRWLMISSIIILSACFLLPGFPFPVRLKVRPSRKARASRWISQPSWARILGLLQWSGSSVEGYQARSVDSSISSPRPLIFHPIQSGACALPVLTPTETVRRRPIDVRPLLRFRGGRQCSNCRKSSMLYL